MNGTQWMISHLEIKYIQTSCGFIASHQQQEFANLDDNPSGDKPKARA